MTHTIHTSFDPDSFRSFLKEIVREVIKEVVPINANQSQEILDVEEAAGLLKYHVTTLYEKTSKKEIPHFKKGNKLYFSRTELINWLTEGKVKTKFEIEEEATTFTLTKKSSLEPS